jgi:tetratricopeptide (TPR) repeat protein
LLNLSLDLEGPLKEPNNTAQTLTAKARRARRKQEDCLTGSFFNTDLFAFPLPKIYLFSRTSRLRGELFHKFLFIIFAGVMFLGTRGAFGEMEIDLGGDTGKTTSAPAAQPTAVPQTVPQAAPQAAPAQQPAQAAPATQPAQTAPQAGSTGSPQAASGENDIDLEEPTPTLVVVHGVEKMKDVYEAGIKAYQQQDYDLAIRYLKHSLTMSPRYTPKYFYAEANAMLGVIYQFHIVKYSLAKHYYLAALRYEKNNKTARKHLREVERHLKNEE